MHLALDNKLSVPHACLILSVSIANTLKTDTYSVEYASSLLPLFVNNNIICMLMMLLFINAGPAPAFRFQHLSRGRGPSVPFIFSCRYSVNPICALATVTSCSSFECGTFEPGKSSRCYDLILTFHQMAIMASIISFFSLSLSPSSIGILGSYS